MIQTIIFYNFKNVFLEFPCSETELESKFIELYETEYHDIAMSVEEIRRPEFLRILEKQLISMDELNYLAKRLTQMSAESVDRFKNMREKFDIRDMKGLINLTFNLEGNITSVDGMKEVYNGQTFPKSIPEDCVCCGDVLRRTNRISLSSV